MTRMTRNGYYASEQKVAICGLSPPPRFKRSLYKSAVRSLCRRKIKWSDQAENLCQMMYVDFSYILVVFSYIDKFLGFFLNMYR